MPKFVKITRTEKGFTYEGKINRIHELKSFASVSIPFREALRLKGKKLRITIEELD